MAREPGRKARDHNTNAGADHRLAAGVVVSRGLKRAYALVLLLERIENVDDPGFDRVDLALEAAEIAGTDHNTLGRGRGRLGVTGEDQADAGEDRRKVRCKRREIAAGDRVREVPDRSADRTDAEQCRLPISEHGFSCGDDPAANR